MKKWYLFLILYLIISENSHAQQSQADANISQRKEYMIKTYKINAKKAELYEKLRIDLLQENDELKEQKMTSSQFKNKQKMIYKKYGDAISQVFSKGRYRSWSIMTQELEYYHMLCDNKLISRDKMRLLQKLESEADENRTTINVSNGEESEKLKSKYSLMEKQKEKIHQILGVEDGDWFINYKEMYLTSLINMDKYKTSFKNAYTIAEIEKEYAVKKSMIFKVKKKSAEKEEDFLLNEENKVKAINASVPSDVAARWKKAYDNQVDFIMAYKYGLSQAQRLKFKSEYKSYAIKEFKILSNKKLSDEDKYSQLKQLNEEFLKNVAPLFSHENYIKWKGWCKYDFQRKMRRKGFIR